MKDNSSILVTKANLNKPLCPCTVQTVALSVTNTGRTPLQKLTVSENLSLSFDEGSAVVFIEGKPHSLKAYGVTGKITFEGISIPPKGNVIIFYRVLTTDS